MKLSPRIQKELVCRAGRDPRAIRMWTAYITFLEHCPLLVEHTPGTAIHHILWQKEYPKFVKSTWNTVRLRHADHVAAAALALAAEPDNSVLVRGYASTLTMCGVRAGWKPTNSKEMIRLYLEGKWTPARIGKKCGVSAHSVYDFLRRNGVPVRGYREAQRAKQQPLPEEAARLY
jgi:hypothetical protein